MTRKVKINGTAVELSKNEAKEVQRILLFSGNERQAQFNNWHQGAPTIEAMNRRKAAGAALGLKVE